MREKGAGSIEHQERDLLVRFFLVKSQVTLQITKHIKTRTRTIYLLFLRYNLTFTVSLTDWPYSNWVASALLREEEQGSFRAGASVGLSENKIIILFFLVVLHGKGLLALSSGNHNQKRSYVKSISVAALLVTTFKCPDNGRK